MGAREVPRESLIIAGGVVMWHPLEVLLYGLWPVARERRLLERLADTDVVGCFARCFRIVETQRLSEPQRLDRVIRRHDLERDQPALGFLEKYLARRENRVADPVERDLEHVATSVEDDADQRQPARLDAVTEV